MKRIIAIITVTLLLASAVMLGGCGGSQQEATGGASAGTEQVQEPAGEEPSDQEQASEEAQGSADNAAADAIGVSETEDLGDKAPQIDGLTYVASEKLAYAERYALHYYEGGYGLIEVFDDTNYLVVPEGGSVPEGLPEDVKVLQKPLDKIYLAATASMSLFNSMDALGNIRMSSLDENGWTYEEPKKEMQAGNIIYAGKYSAPDYETLIDEGCNLAIESTMILHAPEVQEMIEDLDIPVLVDRSSNEASPLGRLEWIKAYAFLTDHQKEAAAFFKEQQDSLAELEGLENTGKTVAYFYFSTDGKVVVRSSKDYIPAMIRMAGGEYIFKNLIDEDNRSNISISVEQFYDVAAEADYIIYNASIDSTVRSMEGLLAKDGIMADFKAVKEGRCYTSGSSVYQRTDLAAALILEFHKILTEDDPSDLQYIEKLK